MAVSRQSNGSVKIYMSWNGATRVQSWRVLAGARPGALSPAGETGRAGFETVATLHAGVRYVAVQALDRQGTVLGTSGTRALAR
jgi:hypothetical protein